MYDLIFNATSDTTGAGIALALGIFVTGLLIFFTIKFIIYAIKNLFFDKINSNLLGY